MTEHCPDCLTDAQPIRQHQADGQTVTLWRCRGCERGWETSYLTAAYADAEEGPGYWDGPWPEGLPWAG